MGLMFCCATGLRIRIKSRPREGADAIIYLLGLLLVADVRRAQQILWEAGKGALGVFEGVESQEWPKSAGNIDKQQKTLTDSKKSATTWPAMADASAAAACLKHCRVLRKSIGRTATSMD